MSHDGGCPFTEVLLDQIEEPGVDVRIMLGNVGEVVRERTGQQLFISSSLAGEHYLGDVTGAPTPPASGPGGGDVCDPGYGPAVLGVDSD